MTDIAIDSPEFREFLTEVSKTDPVAGKALAELMRRQKAVSGVANFAAAMDIGIAARHHHLICDKLDELIAGRISHLMISAPPGSAKSTYCSIAAPAYALGKMDPGNVILSVSHSQDLAQRFSRKTRAVVRDERYVKLFPNSGINPTHKSLDTWSTQNNNEYKTGSVGGSITGNRADILLIDDPTKGRAEADSPAARKKLIDWYHSDASSRVKPQGRRLIIATRWAEEDLIGHLLEEQPGRWEYIRLPAIYEGPNPLWPYPDPLGRVEGEALWPEWQTLEYLLREKGGMPLRDWESLYQCNPRPEQGNFVHRDWLTAYAYWELPEYYTIMQSWDTAGTVNERSNYNVCTTWAITPNKHYYLLDVFKKKMEFTEVQTEIAKQFERFRGFNNRAVNGILIENKGAGQFILQNMKKFLRNSLPAVPFNPDIYGKKDFRFDSVTPYFEAGVVHLPKKGNPFIPNTDWLEDYIEEIVGYPGYKTDDQVDSTSQMLIWGVQKGARRRRMARMAG